MLLEGNIRGISSLRLLLLLLLLLRVITPKRRQLESRAFALELLHCAPTSDRTKTIPVAQLSSSRGRVVAAVAVQKAQARERPHLFGVKKVSY